MSTGKSPNSKQQQSRSQRITNNRFRNATKNKSRSIILQHDGCDESESLPTSFKASKMRTTKQQNCNSASTIITTPTKSSNSLVYRKPGSSRSKYTTNDTGGVSYGVDSTDIVIAGSSTNLQNKHLYTIKPIIPARKKELISVAKAMHREAFAPRVKKLFQRETNAALDAVESGIYIGWGCPKFTWDCIRLDSTSRCFCDHTLEEHEPFEKTMTAASKKQPKRLLKCLVTNCSCRSFNFVPQRPEDIGEWWLRKRPGFDGAGWRAKCRCKHTHVQHNPASKRCKVAGCSCFRFESNFLCAACDRHLEEHETFFEDAKTRQEIGLPCGQHYLPFNELPDLRNICLSGAPEDSRRYEEIAFGPYSIPPPISNKLQTSSTNQVTQFTRGYR